MPNKNKCFKTNDATVARRDRGRPKNFLQKENNEPQTAKSANSPTRNSAAALIKNKWSQRLLTPNHHKQQWNYRLLESVDLRSDADISKKSLTTYWGSISPCATWTRVHFTRRKLSLACLILASHCVCLCRRLEERGEISDTMCRDAHSPIPCWTRRGRAFHFWGFVAFVSEHLFAINSKNQPNKKRVHTFDRQTCGAAQRLLVRDVRINTSSCLLWLRTLSSLLFSFSSRCRVETKA